MTRTEASSDDLRSIEYLITLQRAAELCEVTYDTIYNWYQAGDLKVYRIPRKDSPDDPRESRERSTIYTTQDAINAYWRNRLERKRVAAPKRRDKDRWTPEAEAKLKRRSRGS